MTWDKLMSTIDILRKELGNIERLIGFLVSEMEKFGENKRETFIDEGLRRFNIVLGEADEPHHNKLLLIAVQINEVLHLDSPKPAKEAKAG